MLNVPSVADFKNRFNRDFPYNEDINLGVTDTDIANAFQNANNEVCQSVWGTQSMFTQAYLFVAAHFLVLNLRDSSAGLNGQASWLQASKGVGSVSESFSIPQRILDNPSWTLLSKTTYGMRYLDMLMIQSIGVGFTVPSGSH